MAIVPLVVDVNHANSIDFDKIAAAGIVGVIHKAIQGTFVDNKYATRRPLAQKAGLEWGAYAFNTGDPVADQVALFLKVAAPDDRTSLWLDFEDNKSSQMSASQAREFLDRVDQKTGRACGIYGGNRIREQIKANDDFFPQHPLWLCQYKLGIPDSATLDDLNKRINVPPPWTKYFLLQYTGDGIGPKPHMVNGVGDGSDMNAFNGSAADLRAAWPLPAMAKAAPAAGV
jgi:lysozyme